MSADHPRVLLGACVCGWVGVSEDRQSKIETKRETHSYLRLNKQKKLTQLIFKNIEKFDDFNINFIWNCCEIN